MRLGHRSVVLCATAVMLSIDWSAQARECKPFKAEIPIELSVDWWEMKEVQEVPFVPRKPTPQLVTRTSGFWTVSGLCTEAMDIDLEIDARLLEPANIVEVLCTASRIDEVPLDVAYSSYQGLKGGPVRMRFHLYTGKRPEEASCYITVNPPFRQKAIGDE